MKDYKIIFLRKPNGHAAGCVAIYLNGLLTRDTFESKIVQYQLSVQCPKDRFNRSIARQLALGRLLEKPFNTKPIAIDDIHMVVEGVMQHIATNPAVPKRARQAAKLWLKTKLKGE